jgi:hypothetical protein
MCLGAGSAWGTQFRDVVATRVGCSLALPYAVAPTPSPPPWLLSFVADWAGERDALHGKIADVEQWASSRVGTVVALEEEVRVCVSPPPGVSSATMSATARCATYRTQP